MGIFPVWNQRKKTNLFFVTGLSNHVYIVWGMSVCQIICLSGNSTLRVNLYQFTQGTVFINGLHIASNTSRGCQCWQHGLDLVSDDTAGVLLFHKHITFTWPYQIMSEYQQTIFIWYKHQKLSWQTTFWIMFMSILVSYTGIWLPSAMYNFFSPENCRCRDWNVCQSDLEDTDVCTGTLAPEEGAVWRGRNGSWNRGKCLLFGHLSSRVKRHVTHEM